MVKGWFNPRSVRVNQPEQLLSNYVASGDVAYLNSLVAQFNPMIFHYLLSQSDPHLAEDVLQSMWVKVMHCAASFDVELSQHGKNSQVGRNNRVKSWLFKIARNTLIDELRRQNRWHYQSIQDKELTIETLSVEKNVIWSDQLTAFNDAIAKLPFYQREAFIFQQEGFSLAEICQLTDASFETVKSRIRYAKQRLKSQLELTNECR